MKFWDASALVTLVLAEPGRDQLLEALEQDPVMLVWWGTPVECTSAIARQERDSVLQVAETRAALERLQTLMDSCDEVLPTENVRRIALRLLRVHPLRAADSLQLAAALVAAADDPATLEFVSFDRRLNDAASREGFPVYPVVATD